MGWKSNIGEYFIFSKKDRIAILLILLAISLIYFLPDAVKPSKKSEKIDSTWIIAINQMQIKDSSTVNSYEREPSESNSYTSYQFDKPTGYRQKGELFYFDPNTLSADGWLRLGIREKTVGTIQNYLSKGGKFRKPEDVARIYGLFPNEYDRIAPYIQINETKDENYSDKQYTTNSTANNKPAYNSNSTSRYKTVDINFADTSAFVALPGIGSKLAGRIVNFREKLGGFYSVAQVGETFGLPDSTFQRIKQYLQVGNSSVKKININTASVDELKAHPYIKWALANPILAYRKEHGDFKTVEDIKNIMAVTDEVYNKIAPYLSVN
jgi:competence protein ComEA